MVDGIFKFQNIYLAAALLAYNFHYYGVDRSDSRHQKFMFSDAVTATIYVKGSDGVQALPGSSIKDAEQFFVAESLLFPPTYPEAMRRVKYILHAGDDAGGDKPSYERGGMGGSKMLPNHKSISQVG